MLRQTIKMGAVLLSIAGVFAYAMLNRQLGAMQLREVVPPLGDAFERLMDSRDALPAWEVDFPYFGRHDQDAPGDTSHA